jgi:hypothetical protein
VRGISISISDFSLQNWRETVEKTPNVENPTAESENLRGIFSTRFSARVKEGRFSTGTTYARAPPDVSTLTSPLS